MAIGATGGDGIRAKLAAMRDRMSKIPDAVGVYAVQEVVDRTQRGKDIDGKDFVPYSKSSERSMRGRKTGHVDLNDTGHMLGSMTHKVEGSKTTILFRSDTENDKAYKHQNGIGRLPVRKFFGLDEKIRQGIMRILNKWINNG